MTNAIGIIKIKKIKKTPSCQEYFVGYAKSLAYCEGIN